MADKECTAIVEEHREYPDDRFDAYVVFHTIHCSYCGLELQGEHGYETKNKDDNSKLEHCPRCKSKIVWSVSETHRL